MDEDRVMEAERSDGIGTGSDSGQQMAQKEMKDYSSYIDRPQSVLGLPRGLYMENPGILICTGPDTAESIRNLRGYVEAHRTELVLSGRWAEPAAICFNTRDPATGSYTEQRLDRNLARTIADTWPITRIGARDGSLELVGSEGSPSPLDEMEDLSQFHQRCG